ncbi:uncharacterized protein LOC108915656 isoform X2 [Anoplophora glabripennis]|uniref:uncharacterized protein LOC108915656 isoform X2 n=1 Tax=Anoplophora glabripennis TaxID=217634 RepID=UPI00087369C2|nr:uncharacterized protein LOC108915656 isoform X2 [Anoplophora glabripennis]
MFTFKKTDMETEIETKANQPDVDSKADINIKTEVSMTLFWQGSEKTRRKKTITILAKLYMSKRKCSQPHF